MGRLAARTAAPLALLAAAAAHAQETARQAGAQAAKSSAEKLRDLGLAGAPVEGPGLFRLLLAFALVVALAWAATWLLKRYGFRGTRAPAGAATPIRHLARGALPGGIACHVVEAQGRQVLITVSRHGVSSLVLGDAAPPAALPAPSARAPAVAAAAEAPPGAAS
jgi:hypothetical protein